jgi:hypothetical protein
LKGGGQIFWIPFAFASWRMADAREMAEYVKVRGKEMKKLYFSYTTCSRCAKVYGKNYVVLFARVE